MSKSKRPPTDARKGGVALAKQDDETKFALRDGTFEFTALDHEQTGLPFIVWVQPSMGASYGVRVAVSPDRFTSKKDWALVMTEPKPLVVKGKMNGQNLDLLQQWLTLNRSVLISYWNCDGRFKGSFSMMDAIKSL